MLLLLRQVNVLQLSVLGAGKKDAISAQTVPVILLKPRRRAV